MVLSAILGLKTLKKNLIGRLTLSSRSKIGPIGTAIVLGLRINFLELFLEP